MGFMDEFNEHKDEMKKISEAYDKILEIDLRKSRMKHAGKDAIDTPDFTVAVYTGKKKKGMKIYKDDVNYWIVDKKGMIKLMNEGKNSVIQSGKGKGNPRWEYYDSRGVKHYGWVEKTVDKGGTDVTYFFRDEKTNELSVASGSVLKKAKRIWK